jgi:hypothetical protein
MSDREDVVKEALADVLHEGERFVVSRSKGDVEVRDAGSRLKEDNARLYGHMLGLNQTLSEAGTNVLLWGIIVGCGLAIGLHVQAFTAVLGDHEVMLRSGWVYGFIVVAVTMASFSVTTRLERAAYERNRDALMEEIASANLDRPTLLTLIEGDSALSNVAEQLKRH